ncbi:uncharacterized protein BYT42DRAFT_580106 [Radiomyces spectabilis]|uniref:uncharacterized protein n=1 Tax=Radiomyces spectabilis TaxID=64574 RepID=UPI00221F9535|nr:uncharacterized protein BYT42DRAFT_580106 [Radiomyces spectabilis]KAI8371402.1 hypothetical protein BYT42DRAFT_580106 [Radiomyces spectabilis]
MFVPTIKSNPVPISSNNDLQKRNTTPQKTMAPPAPYVPRQAPYPVVSRPGTKPVEPVTEPKKSSGKDLIEVDPDNDRRIIVTLADGRKYAADRYCAHGRADLSRHGQIAKEGDYPPEVGPVLLCPIHYWEFALDKGGLTGAGRGTINACPIEVASECKSAQKELQW